MSGTRYTEIVANLLCQIFFDLTMTRNRRQLALIKGGSIYSKFAFLLFVLVPLDPWSDLNHNHGTR